MNKQELECVISNRADGEIDILQIISIFWKRKWLIVIIIIFFTAVAGVTSFMIPDVYEITTLLEPASDSNGQVRSSHSIRELVVTGSFNKKIAEKLKINMRDIPDFKATIPPGTNLVEISVKSKGEEQAIQICSELVNYIVDDIEEKIAPRVKAIKNRIEKAKYDESSLTSQIELVESHITKTMDEIETLESMRKKASVSPGGSVNILLYSNEIHTQQNRIFQLQKNLAELQNKENLYANDIKDALLEINQIQNTSVHKEPTLSREPVSPNRVLIVSLGVFLGIFTGFVSAFMIELISKMRIYNDI